MTSRTVAAVLLAAGESSRMGESKALLPWMGKALVQFQMEQLLEAGLRPIIAVVGHEAERVQAALMPSPEATVLLNPDYRLGKSTSIRAGVVVLPPNTSAVMILGVDQPRRATTLKRLLDSHLAGDHLITLPTFRGQRGHPPVLSAALKSELLSLSEERQGLREVILRHLPETTQVPFDSQEVLFNLNTPDDYRQALTHFQRRTYYSSKFIPPLS